MNTRRSWWRARWRQESPVASVPDRPDPADGGGDPADRQAVGSLVRSALARLPRQQRAVLVLRYLRGPARGGGGVAARLLGRVGEDARAPGYGFTVAGNEQTTAGYVDVDGQGRVRRLVAELTAGVRAKKWVMATGDVTFSDFGAAVSVTAPPASQVHLLKGPVAMIALGW